VGTLAAISAGTAAVPFGGAAAVAIVASWAETVGFYGTMAWRDLSRRLRHSTGRPRRGRTFAVFATTSALIAEFGPAEALDTLIVRPLLIATSLQMSSTTLVGIVAGKLMADLVFYIPVIASWELLRRRHAGPAPGSTGGQEVQG
jgi:hypothetical protein